MGGFVHVILVLAVVLGLISLVGGSNPKCAKISALACDNAAHAIGCNPRTRTCSTAGDLQTSG